MRGQSGYEEGEAMAGDPWNASNVGGGALDWATGLEWHDQAACASIGTELFFADKPGEVESAKLAKRICMGSEKHGMPPCPVLMQCRDWAIENNEAFGIFGGLSPRQRMKLRTDMRRANGLSVRCRYCRRSFIADANQALCSDECRLQSRRRHERERCA
jgi:WhiB family redox-sensing transcriptional regulator